MGLAIARRLEAAVPPAWQFDSALGERKLREQLAVATLLGFNAQDQPLRLSPV